MKNRRLAAMQRLQNEGEYFSGDAMRERAPLLYHQLIGRYTGEGGRGGLVALPCDLWRVMHKEDLQHMDAHGEALGVWNVCVCVCVMHQTTACTGRPMPERQNPNTRPSRPTADDPRHAGEPGPAAGPCTLSSLLMRQVDEIELHQRMDVEKRREAAIEEKWDAQVCVCEGGDLVGVGHAYTCTCACVRVSACSCAHGCVCVCVCVCV